MQGPSARVGAMRWAIRKRGAWLCSNGQSARLPGPRLLVAKLRAGRVPGRSCARARFDHVGFVAVAQGLGQREGRRKQEEARAGEEGFLPFSALQTFDAPCGQCEGDAECAPNGKAPAGNVDLFMMVVAQHFREGQRRKEGEENSHGHECHIKASSGQGHGAADGDGQRDAEARPRLENPLGSVAADEGLGLHGDLLDDVKVFNSMEMITCLDCLARDIHVFFCPCPSMRRMPWLSGLYGVEWGMAKKKTINPTELSQPDVPDVLKSLGIDCPESLRGSLTRMAGAIKRPMIVCASGLRLSAQANEYTYCVPRENQGPYESVEMGYPSREIERALPWAEEPSSPTETVYGRVPIGLLAQVVAENGGRAPGQEDWKPASMSMLGAMKGFDAEPGPALAKAGDLLYPVGVADFEMAAKHWVQMAVLGSPRQEEAARFSIKGPAGEDLADWGDVMVALASSDSELAAESDWSNWHARVVERCEIGMAAKKPKAKAGKARHRPGL